ncbi:MAG: HipA protein [Acetivibrio ethanolgignens]
MKKRYVLLNKDVEIAQFHIGDLDNAVIDKKMRELPAWIRNLPLLIANRRAPKHRENMKLLLKESGCDTLEGYLDITHALSLIDTFWVKPAESTLEWKKVSLYTHPFNEVIAKTAFEGGLHGRQLSTTSPEYGTDGSFAKCWIRENDTIKMLKRGSSGTRNAGLEPYSEFYASQLVGRITKHFVPYGIRTHNGKLCTVCDCFTNESYGFVPYDAVFPGNTDVLTVLENMKGLGLEGQAKTMFVVDAVIYNEDRHKNNFGFIVDNEKQEIVDMAPLFDHNVSLLPYAEEEDFAKLEEYLSLKGPRIGEDFYRTAKYCLTADTRKALIELKDFQFERDSKLNLPEWRLERLEKFVQENIRKILE